MTRTSSPIERARWIYDHVPAHLDRILDVGCYDGALAAASLEKVDAAFGIDLDSTGLRHGKLLHSRVNFARASAATVPFPDDSFDCVILSETLEHVPVTLEDQVLAEIHRVLRPAGTLLVTVPHAGVFQHLDPMNLRHNIHKIIRGLDLERGNTRSGYMLGDIKGHKHYSLSELEGLLDPLYRIQQVYFSGCLLYPLSLYAGFLPDTLRRSIHINSLMNIIRSWEYAHSFGSASYNIALAASPKKPVHGANIISETEQL